jgi:hypothetical protein
LAPRPQVLDAFSQYRIDLFHTQAVVRGAAGKFIVADKSSLSV